MVGLTGGPGSAYGVRVLEALRAARVESHVVMCGCARSWIGRETGRDPDAVLRLAHRTYPEANQAARISSGSFITAGMIVAPCSTRSLASIASGYANNLIHRAADVTIKEGRRLVLVVGEPELGAIDMENLARMSLVPGVTVCRPRSGGAADTDATIADALELFGIDRRAGRSPTPLTPLRSPERPSAESIARAPREPREAPPLRRGLDAGRSAGMPRRAPRS